MIQTKLKKIKLLLLDVDGILTDGSIMYTGNGEEIKTFNAKDGLGIKLLINAGIKVGIITGRKSKALTSRCEDLGIDLVFDGIQNKINALETILKQTAITPEETAFAGDDLPDLPVMKRVGLSMTVPDASCHVIDRADFVTAFKGGHGAVREICEDILKAKNLWEKTLAEFLL
ncbi:MAG: HAD-IIIA family hydrolase [Nitrospiraceae bacterium]|nr:HAD-IIIA family hydrolase [Nitrospiraceae bacterium]